MACSTPQLNAALHALNLGMSGRGKSGPKRVAKAKPKRHPACTATWDVHGAIDRPVVHPVSKKVIPVAFVFKCTEVRHKKWSHTMESNDIVLWGDKQVHHPSPHISLTNAQTNTQTNTHPYR